MNALERWCGIECTVNRVGDRYHDQLLRSGHHDRPGDLDLLADLGFDAIRYPLLWERISPDAPDRAEWFWSDDRLARIDRLGMRVIAGLVHHGSGPRYTDLLADTFAPGLARHAAAVAARYPAIEAWTPVNEPVTTARFSALYGHWYPHACDERSFWRALLNQVDATRLAMRAVRVVNPSARLVQTDDLGRTWATLPLADQAAFDNQRRWAGWDLLCGRVTAEHPLWHRLCTMGLGEQLRRIADDPCPPDIIGLNHYPTSDRFLDHRIHRYPDDERGSNGRIAFADMPAVRVLDPAPEPFAQALKDAWDRYQLPLAITEVHIGCTREEQMRWATDAWAAARAAREKGADVRAVTAWSALGSHDWDTLVTAPGAYEPGLFELTNGSPRKTALATHWKTLEEPATPAHPVSVQPGWWRRPDRIIFSPIRRTATPNAYRDQRTAPERVLLICGEDGPLAQALAHGCVARGIPCHLMTGCGSDLFGPDAIARARPWAVIEVGGAVRKDGPMRRAAASDALMQPSDGVGRSGHAWGTAVFTVADNLVSPEYLPALADAILTKAIDDTRDGVRSSAPDHAR